MALVIRLKPTGKKGKAFYKIVITENLTKRNGKELAEFGYYDPIKKDFKINTNLLLKFLKSGAQMTRTTRGLIEKLLQRYNIA